MSRLERLRAPIRRAWWRALEARATDVTNRQVARTLVVAPHPDDESIGCGATIARRIADGGIVDVVVCSDGASLPSVVLDRQAIASIRSDEVHAATTHLGVHEVVELGLPDDLLGQQVSTLIEALRAHVIRFEPDEILVTSRLDWHADHRAVSHAARRVAAEHDIALAEYPIWFRADGPWRAWSAAQSKSDRLWSTVADPIRHFRPGSVERIATSPYLHAKETAMDAHRSQFVGIPDDPAWPVLPPTWRASFLGAHELFFRIR